MDHLAEARTSGCVIGESELTHGTLESRNLDKSRLVYEKILNLRSVRHSAPAQLIAGSSEIAVVSVGVGDAIHEQGHQNRWILMVADAQSVVAAHDAAIEASPEWGILSVGDVEETDGVSRFVLRDSDSNWWEVTNRTASYYQAIFERGDIA